MGLLTCVSLCLFGLLISNPFPGAEANSCFSDWKQNQGNCYAYFDYKLTWAEAEIECQSYGHGAHLASILSQAETAFITNYINTYQKDKSKVWIGLHDPRKNWSWRWTDKSVYNYKTWHNNQPDHWLNSEYCVELSGLTLWNDNNCRNTNTYICKYEL